MKTRTKVGLSIITIILSIALLFTACYTMNNTVDECAEANAKVRTVELSDNGLDNQNIYEQFDDYSFSTEGNVTYFEGNKSFDEAHFKDSDDIDIKSDVQKTAKIQLNVSLNTETNIITLLIQTTTEEQTKVEKVQGKVFDNNGKVDALFCIEGENVLLSELTGNGVIDNCGWLSRFIKTILTPVSHIIEECFALSNRNHNRKLQEPNNYINNQSAYGNWKYGINNNIKDSGCGVIAIYNVMRKLGRPQNLADVIYDCDSKNGNLFFGIGGVDFTHFREYFYRHFISVNVHFGFNSMKSALENMPTNKMAIVSYWTNPEHTAGHYIAVERIEVNGNSQYNFYNYKNSSRPDLMTAINLSDFGYGLINGFVIG